MQNNSIKQQLIDRVKSDSLVHAYIVEGANIQQTLYDCASVLLCDNFGCGRCDNCNKIASRCHADCFLIPTGTDKNRITVKDIELIINESIRRPVESDNRVFLIDATNSMGQGSEMWQNKLLKTLEEPPQGIYILIGVASSDNLLATIQSRCQVISSTVDSVPYITHSLIALGYKEKVASLASLLCAGNIDTAKYIASNSLYTDALDNVVNMLANLTSVKDSLQYVNKISADSYIGKLLPILTIVMSQSIKMRLCDQLATLALDQDTWKAINSNYTIASCIAIIQLINKANTQLTKGCNYKVVIDNLVANMLEVKYRCRQ